MFVYLTNTIYKSLFLTVMLSRETCPKNIMYVVHVYQSQLTIYILKTLSYTIYWRLFATLSHDIMYVYITIN